MLWILFLQSVIVTTKGKQIVGMLLMVNGMVLLSSTLVHVEACNKMLVDHYLLK